MVRKALFFLLFLSLSFSSTTTLQDLLKNFCVFMYDLVGNTAFLMVLMSSIVFSTGQLLGAEMRARMVVWANNLFLGAITGILLAVFLPWMLALVVGRGGFDPSQCEFV